MSKVESVPNCPRCRAIGNVVKHVKDTVFMKCPICGTSWKTWSEICPDCKKPNGFAIKGPCSKCYSERYKIS